MIHSQIWNLIFVLKKATFYLQHRELKWSGGEEEWLQEDSLGSWCIIHAREKRGLGDKGSESGGEHTQIDVESTPVCFMNLRKCA